MREERETSTVYVRIDRVVAANAREYCHAARIPLSRYVEESLRKNLGPLLAPKDSHAPKKPEA